MRHMTEELFRQDARLAMCSAQVLAITPQGIVLDRTVFYPLGGGQAGDTGMLLLEDGSEIAIADTRKEKDDTGAPTGRIVHMAAPGQETLLARLQAGDVVAARIDWERRHRMMRLHSATHLLCHLVPQLVNGCSITPDYARMDFAMTDPLDKDVLTQGLAGLVAAAHPFAVESISDEELDAKPQLVKSMSVLAKGPLERIASEQLGRPVTVGAIEFTPWTLELTLRDIAIGGAQGGPPQLQIARIYADAELQSLVRLAPVVDALAIDAPHLRLTHLSDGHYDVDDILAAARRPQRQTGQRPRTAGALQPGANGRHHRIQRPQGRRTPHRAPAGPQSAFHQHPALATRDQGGAAPVVCRRRQPV
jgi:misacylated tRNA(Ala) deacylase